MLATLAALPLLVKAGVLGVVEGLTEFLPISSTGHLIIAASLLSFSGEKEKLFSVAIQTGAMFAVMWYFRARIGTVMRGLLGPAGVQRQAAWRFARNLLVAFMPAAVLGLAFASRIKAYLFSPLPVATAFIAGALVILWVERSRRGAAAQPRVRSIEQMTLGDSFKVGIAQAFALIPGTSRSGATIIGGMIFGLSRQAATEFSFFLAMPTLIAAGAYDLFKYRALLVADDLWLFGVGTVFAFFSALACVHWLIRYVATHDFVAFAWYRIAFGLVVLATAWSGLVVWAS